MKDTNWDGESLTNGDQAEAVAQDQPAQELALETQTPEIPALETQALETQALETQALETQALETQALQAQESAGSPFGETRIYYWRWEKQTIGVHYEVFGQGSPILLLPALSTISHRDEMRRLGELLAEKYQVYLFDWAGFGSSDRPKVKYSPKLYQALLRNFVQETFQEPIVVMAAGHAAGYVMELARMEPSPWSWVVLAAPTWRGPLPTMMGETKRAWFKLLQGLINLPLIGQFLYRLNTTKFFLSFMMGRHVYADRARITPAVLQEKFKITQVKGARFASAAFVTGALDPVRSSQDWLAYFQGRRIPVLLVIGENMPPKSRAEAEVVAHFGGVQILRMPGSLGLHEEYPEQLFEGIAPFLAKYLSKRKDN
ncbi:alpha/beta hydrolase [Alkalinema sp. FACHB-956]|uniref:alpha/beta fold hydrolase n=1 Tax=Alkalinema sp. FACHB-956 TaxID=2692768 RepID=UPI00168769F8|nr:alpha/beta hydrolase [Alkalinema sp. FACHB-956]MBD2327346.1 alpha/beta hydrolase [Alkalinema sp. FACHB-956]